MAAIGTTHFAFRNILPQAVKQALLLFIPFVFFDAVIHCHTQNSLKKLSNTRT